MMLIDICFIVNVFFGAFLGNRQDWSRISVDCILCRFLSKFDSRSKIYGKWKTVNTLHRFDGFERALTHSTLVIIKEFMSFWHQTTLPYLTFTFTLSPVL